MSGLTRAWARFYAWVVCVTRHPVKKVTQSRGKHGAYGYYVCDKCRRDRGHWQTPLR